MLLSSSKRRVPTKTTTEASSYALYRKCVVYRLDNTKRNCSEGVQFLTKQKQSCAAATFGSACEARSPAVSSEPMPCLRSSGQSLIVQKRCHRD